MCNLLTYRLHDVITETSHIMKVSEEVLQRSFLSLTENLLHSHRFIYQKFILKLNIDIN